MNGDNLDAACAIAEHEIAFIVNYFRSSRLVWPAPGETHLDAVLKASGTVGARFSREDKVRCFNFAKLIGDQQMDIISDTHSGWVRPKVVTLSPVTAEAVANLPTGTVWVPGAAAAGRVHWMAWSGWKRTHARAPSKNSSTRAHTGPCPHDPPGRDLLN